MDTVEITLPVTRSAAERLGPPGERARLGAGEVEAELAAWKRERARLRGT